MTTNISTPSRTKQDGGETLTTAPAAATESTPSLPSPSQTSAGRNPLDLASVAPILNAGFRAVLAEASKRGVLKPPYGRTAMPDPNKIIEDDPFGSTGEENGEADENDAETKGDDRRGSSGSGGGDEDDEDDDDDKLLEYKFDYGFNPLVFLGDFLRRNNPAAIQARREKRIADLAYLRQRAVKGLDREDALTELRALVIHRCMGLVHGPIVGDVSDCGGLVWAKTFRPGQLMVDLSRHEDFRTVCRQGSTKADRSTDCLAVVEFDELAPNTTWHHRTYLHNPRKGFNGPAAGFCTKGTFSTLPERDGDAERVFRFVVFSLHGLGRKRVAAERRDEIEGACSAICAVEPKVCVVLGEPSTPRDSTTMTRGSVQEGFGELQETVSRIPALSCLMRSYGFLTAPGILRNASSKRQKDRRSKPKREGSRAEGAIDSCAKKRGSARAGGNPEGGGDKVTAAPVPDWALRCPESWGSRMLGLSAEMFLIDARSGSVGEEQLAWVTEAVEESNCTWKLIACGVPVGFQVAPRDRATSTDEDAALQHAAAAKIQATMRSRLVSPKPSTKSTTPAAVATKSVAPVPAAAAAATLDGVSSTASGKECDRPLSPVDGGDGLGAENRATGECVGGNTPWVAMQMQDMVSQLHARGCANVVLITPARSRPHALSFFSGHEAEGRFPVYELGCCGLLPPHRSHDATADSEATEPCPDLAPSVLMPQAASPAFSEGVAGMACSISVGEGCEGQEGGGGANDGLSFVVSGQSGEEISSLRLVAAV